MLEGRSGIRELDKPFVSEFKSPVRIGGPLQESFDEHLSRVELRRLSFMQKMSLVLGRRLWENAGAPEVDTRRLMISIGLALGSTEEIPLQYDAWREKGLRAVSPLAVQMHMPNASAAAVGLDRKAKAGIISPIMADASGAAAIAEAWRQIVLGEADIAICGGVETHIEAVPVAAFWQLGLLSTNNDDPPGACRPFDKDRDGMVLGEAGALMLIETEEHAKARGAPILARVMGAAMTSDGTTPSSRTPAVRPQATRSSVQSNWPGLAPTRHRPHQRPRHRNHRSVTWPRLAPSATRSATTSLRYTRPKRRWGIRWARPERWRPC